MKVLNAGLAALALVGSVVLAATPPVVAALYEGDLTHMNQNLDREGVSGLQNPVFWSKFEVFHQALVNSKNISATGADAKWNWECTALTVEGINAC